METRTYFASSVPAAMEVARRELGPDAMLVSSAPSPEAARRFGRLEVIFAWERGKPEAAKPGSEDAIHMPQLDGPALEEIRLEISALRSSIGMRPASRQPAVGTPAQGKAEIDAGAVRSLCDAGFQEDTARQIVSAAERSGEYRHDGMVRELLARLPITPFKPLRSEECRVLAFVGPAGRGKTTSLIKIAVRYGLANRIPTRIYSAGAHVPGAAEQMARYAAIIGVPFEAIESFDSMNLVLHGDRWKGLILIDTPGAGSTDRREMDSMAKFFSRWTEIERHLVIRADARSADMQNMLSRYAAIQPSRLLFTGLDEVKGLGAAADTMIRSGIGATFFGTGPGIPDDIEEVSAAKLVRSLWAPKAAAARAA